MDDQLGPESAFPGARRLFRLPLKKAWRLLDGRSRAICAVVSLPAVFAAGFAAAALATREAEPERVKEARALGLSYEEVLADPAAAKDKPVLWCIDHPALGYAYAGNPSRPVILENDAALPRNSPTSGGRCSQVLAVVTGAGNGVVRLQFVSLR